MAENTVQKNMQAGGGKEATQKALRNSDLGHRFEQDEDMIPDLSVQDENVDDEGFCTMVQDGEMARANSGGPCDEY